MIFRQLFDPVSSTYTYLIGSRRGGEALIIDPVLDRVDRYIQLIRELELELVKAIDTHIHADHLSGLGALRDRTHCVTVMGAESGVDVVSMRVAEGDRVEIEGGIGLDPLYTPGHTSESYSFLMGDRVFTGDTLLIRGTGRTDFQNGDPRAQYQSLFGKLLKLADETLVYPGPRLQGRHGLDHRRGEALQPAPPGALDRRVRRDHEQAQARQPQDDGRRGARQPQARDGAAGDRRPRVVGHRRGPAALDRPTVRRRSWSTCASAASASAAASFRTRCTRRTATPRRTSAPAGSCTSWRRAAAASSSSTARSANDRRWRSRWRGGRGSRTRATSRAASRRGARPAARSRPSVATAPQRQRRPRRVIVTQQRRRQAPAPSAAPK